MGRALIIAKGSFGDIIPMYAIAKELRGRGHRVLFATQARHLHAAHSLGLDVARIDRCDDLSSSSKARSSRFLPWISNDALGGTRRSFQAELEVLMPLARTSDVVIGNQLAISGPLVAGSRGCPWIYCAVSPLGLASQDNPCLFPLIHRLQRPFIGNALVDACSLALVRGYSSLFSSFVARAQVRLGLRHLGHPRFAGLFSRELNLILTSPRLFGRLPVSPPHAVVTGWTWLEPWFLRDSEKEKRALAFMQGGSPPLLYALGGNARSRPGSFFQESLKASRRLGMRTLIVASSRFHAAIPASADVCVTSYLPYSLLFPHVLAVVHSGGIGTIGWSIRCNRPSLLVPGADDQFDNSFRAMRGGLAQVLPRRGYRASAVASALETVLGDDAMAARLRKASTEVAQEDGAVVACDHIEQFLSRRSR